MKKYVCEVLEDGELYHYEISEVDAKDLANDRDLASIMVGIPESVPMFAAAKVYQMVENAVCEYLLRKVRNCLALNLSVKELADLFYIEDYGCETPEDDELVKRVRKMLKQDVKNVWFLLGDLK